MNEQTIAQARKTTQDLTAKLQTLHAFLGSLNDYAQKGWKIPITIGDTTVDYVIDNTMKTALIAQYTTLKNDLVATYQQLP